MNTNNTGATFDSLTVRNNNLFNNPNGGSPFFSGNTITNYINSGKQTTDPLFVSSTDLHLQPSSPCIGAAYAYGYGNNIGAYSGIIPTITWVNPANIVYGTTLSSTQLNASASTSGTFSYNYSIGTTLNAGTYSLITTFTPTDQSTYSIATKTVPFTVNQASATLTYSNLTKTYTGSPLQPTVTTNPAFLLTVNTTYSGVGQIPTNAASYNVVSGLSNINYSASPISGVFTINPAPVTITVSNLIQTYTGSQLPVTVTTNPNVSGITVTYDGSPTPSITAGSHTIVATLTNANYTATPVTTTLVINKATPTVSWSALSAITYGTALSGTQLNATASMAGSLVYSPASGTILNAGVNQVLSVNFTPTDATNYNLVNNTNTTITVNKAVATLSLSNLTQTYDGLPKPVTVTTNPIGLTPITVTYNGSMTVPSAVGSYSVIASLISSNYTASPASGTLVISASGATIFITNYSNLVYNGSLQVPTVTCAYSYSITYNGSSTAPTNVGSYATVAIINDGVHIGKDSVTMTIIKATPVIAWATPSAITYPTALDGSNLNASSTVAGSFVYTPASGSVLNPGNYILSVAFTPTDASNYNLATKTVSITINSASATLSLSGLNQTYDGTPKPVVVSSNPNGLSGITILYNGSSTVPTNAGSYPITVSLVNSNYTASPVSGTLVIANASSILTYPTPLAVPQGTLLSSLQLNATSNIAGTFSYNYPLNYILQSNVTLIATFTPTNSNYNVQTISVFLSVYGNPINNKFIKKGKFYPTNSQ